MFHSETLDDEQSVYKRIVDRLEDLQQSHQELVTRTAESGVHEDPKTFESKQKGILTMSTQKGPATTRVWPKDLTASLITLQDLYR